MIRNQKGFSLTQVLVAAAIIGGLSLTFMKLMQNVGQAQNFAHSKADELELKTSIRMLLDNENICRLSLAGNGPSGSPSDPVLFNKRDIDEPNEGLDIAFYLSNQAGDARGIKKFNGRDNNPDSLDKSRFGKLRIKTMKLIMNNGTGSNYSNSPAHNDIGIIRVVVEKKVSKRRTRDMIMDFDVNVGMATGQSPDSSGQTRILTCQRVHDSTKTDMIKTYGYYVYTTRRSVHGSTLTMSIDCPAGSYSLGTSGVIQNTNTLTCYSNNFHGLKDQPSASGITSSLSRVSQTHSYNNDKRESICGFLTISCYKSDDAPWGLPTYNSSCTNGCSKIRRGLIEDLGWI